MSTHPATVDEYIAAFPPHVQDVLRTVRATVRKAAPRAQERISYRMPALFQDGVLVYFGAFKHHLGLFPPVQDPALRAQVAPYAGPKGNLRFPYDEPLPLKLITAIVKARLESNQTRPGARRGASKSS